MTRKVTWMRWMTLMICYHESGIEDGGDRSRERRRTNERTNDGVVLSGGPQESKREREKKSETKREKSSSASNFFYTIASAEFRVSFSLLPLAFVSFPHAPSAVHTLLFYARTHTRTVHAQPDTIK